MRYRNAQQSLLAEEIEIPATPDSPCRAALDLCRLAPRDPEGLSFQGRERSERRIDRFVCGQEFFGRNPVARQLAFAHERGWRDLDFVQTIGDEYAKDLGLIQL